MEIDILMIHDVFLKVKKALVFYLHLVSTRENQYDHCYLECALLLTLKRRPAEIKEVIVLDPP